jgi:hypothetical protein
MRPAFAFLKIVMRDIFSSFANSAAVSAFSCCSSLSVNDKFIPSSFHFNVCRREISSCGVVWNPVPALLSEFTTQPRFCDRRLRTFLTTRAFHQVPPLSIIYIHYTFNDSPARKLFLAELTISNLLFVSCRIQTTRKEQGSEERGESDPARHLAPCEPGYVLILHNRYIFEKVCRWSSIIAATSDPRRRSDQALLLSSPIRWVGETRGIGKRSSLSIQRFESLFCTVAHLGPDRLRSQPRLWLPKNSGLHKQAFLDSKNVRWS